VPVFSFLGSVQDHPPQVHCHITRTNARTHDIIRANLDRSPMYSGEIEGVGPRYCPSIEDKVVRFADKGSHQIFIEPEGLDTCEVYPNGISTSLPFDVQEKVVRSIQGFEQAHITRPGYAIEYDFFDPRDLKPSLETAYLQGLYFAGQINGTTGYEEAAAQGLIAGINAGFRETEGYDFDLSYRLATDKLGTFNLSWQTTYTTRDEIKVDTSASTLSQQLVGYATSPGFLGTHRIEPKEIRDLGNGFVVGGQHVSGSSGKADGPFSGRPTGDATAGRRVLRTVSTAGRGPVRPPASVVRPPGDSSGPGDGISVPGRYSPAASTSGGPNRG
jgi:hypothetical protein